MLFQISGTRVNELLERHGFSRNKLAVKAEIDPKTATKIINSGPSGTMVHLETADKVAKALKAKPNDIRVHGPEIDARRAALHGLAEQVLAGDATGALENAFWEPHLASRRAELLRFEDLQADAEVRSLLGDDAALRALQAEVADWLLKRVSELCDHGDIALTSHYDRVCDHNLPTNRLLATKATLVEDSVILLRERETQTIVLNAPHGRGKSSLALRVARRVTERFSVAWKIAV